jgi:hypothetical protein
MTAVLSQAVPGSTSPAPDLDNIRKALNETQAISLVPPARADGPVFRVTVLGGRPTPAPWDGWSAAPTYVRPWFRADHHEFLETVTPEEFRGATLYPVGVDVVSLVQFVSKHIRKAARKSQERQARQEVREALAQLLACREDPTRSGCSR